MATRMDLKEQFNKANMQHYVYFKICMTIEIPALQPFEYCTCSRLIKSNKLMCVCVQAQLKLLDLLYLVKTLARA